MGWQPFLIQAIGAGAISEAGGKSHPKSGSFRQRGLVRGLIWGVLLGIFLAAWFSSPGLAEPATGTLLEDLRYRVDVLMLHDVVRARITLKKLGPGQYQAEFMGEPHGAFKTLYKERRTVLQTNMVLCQGRLQPLIYREETRRKGQNLVREFRFDYDQGRLEMWESKDGKGPVRTWQTALKEPIYDYLSAFYNCRLGLMGPVKEGKNYQIAGIPYPKPEKIEMQIGPETRQGRKTTLTIVNKTFTSSPGVVFVYLDGKMVPKQAWTKVLYFGKMKGELLPESKPLEGRLSELPPEGIAAADDR